MKQQPVSEAEVHAYIDGKLPDSRCAAVDAYLAEQPGEAQRVQAYRAQDAALRQNFAAVAAEPVPARLRQLAERPPAGGAGDLPPAGSGTTATRAASAWRR